MKISNSVTYSSSNNGQLRIKEDTTDLENTGVDNGYGFFDDIYINPYVDVIISVNGQQTIALENEEDVVIEFSLTSSVVNGKADFRFQNLEPKSFYRLYIDSSVPSTENGIAYGKSKSNGTIEFKGVKLNE